MWSGLFGVYFMPKVVNLGSVTEHMHLVNSSRYAEARIKMFCYALLLTLCGS